MNTYALLSGELVEYPDQPAAVNAFIARVTAAVNDPNATPAEVLALAYGVENPVLDTRTQPGRAIVTKAVFENPVYRIFGDLVGRKQLFAEGETDDVTDDYTVSVKEAAQQLGLTESSVRTAIAGRKLSAVKRNGDWYIHPLSVASYKVSNRGRKKAVPAERPTDPAEVRVRCGSAPGGSLAVRIAGADIVVEGKKGSTVFAHFPANWARAAVKMTTDSGVRVFELEPAPGESGEVEHLGLSVTGPFKVVKKHNVVKAATAVWKHYSGSVAVS